MPGPTFMGEVGRLNVSSPGNAYAATINISSNVSKSTATVSSFLVVTVYWEPGDIGFTYPGTIRPTTSGDYDGSLWGTRWSTDFSNYRGNHFPLDTGDPCARTAGPVTASGIVTGSTRKYRYTTLIIHVYADLTTSDTITLTGPSNITGGAISTLRFLVHWYKGAKVIAASTILPGFGTVAGNTTGTSASAISDISTSGARAATGLTLSSGNGTLVYVQSDDAVGTGRTVTFTADTTFSPDWVEDYPSTRLAVGSRQLTSSITSVSFSWTTNTGPGTYNWTFFPWDTQTIYAPDVFGYHLRTRYKDSGSNRLWTVEVIDETGKVGFNIDTTQHPMVCWWRLNPSVSGVAGMNGVFNFGLLDNSSQDRYRWGKYLIQPGGTTALQSFTVPTGSTYHFEAYLYDGILSALMTAALTDVTATSAFTPLLHKHRDVLWSPARNA